MGVEDGILGGDDDGFEVGRFPAEEAGGAAGVEVAGDEKIAAVAGLAGFLRKQEGLVLGGIGAAVEGLEVVGGTAALGSEGDGEVGLPEAIDAIRTADPDFGGHTGLSQIAAFHDAAALEVAREDKDDVGGARRFGNDEVRRGGGEDFFGLKVEDKGQQEEEREKGAKFAQGLLVLRGGIRRGALRVQVANFA